MRTAIDLGHNLGLTVVAEGVEGAEHVARAARARLRHRPGLPLRAGRCRRGRSPSCWTASAPSTHDPAARVRADRGRRRADAWSG